MNFMEHIRQIDKRIERKKEEEYKMTLFGAEAATEGMGMVSTSTTMVMPSITGVNRCYQNGELAGTISQNSVGNIICRPF